MDREQALEKYGKVFEAGTTLFYEGDPGSKLWIINEGRIRLSKHVCSEEVVLEDLNPGEFCGELALVTDGVQPVTATVIEKARLLVIDAKQFESMLRSNGELSMRIMKKLAGRLNEAQFRISVMQMKNSLGRVMLQLRRESQAADPASPVFIPDNLAEVLGLDAVELDIILDKLALKNLIAMHDDKTFKIIDDEEFTRYLSYLELHDRYAYFDKE